MNKIIKWSKKILLVIATALFAVSSMTNVNAAAESIQLISAKQSGKYIAGVSFSYKRTAEADYYYCLNIHKNTAQNVEAKLVKSGSIVDGGIVHILKNGYPYKSITGDKDKDFYITQTAVWWYLDNTTGSTNLGEGFKVSGSDSYNLRKYVKALVQEGMNHKNDSLTIKDTKLVIGTSSNKLSLQGSNFESTEIKATTISNLNSYKVTLSNAPSNTKIVKGGNEFKYNGEFAVNANESFKVVVPASSVSELQSTIKVTAKGTGNVQYKGYEYQPVNKNMQNIAIVEPIQETVKSTIELEIDSSKVTITKIDAKTKQPLANAKLVIKDANGKTITTWTSSVNGHVVRNLPNGTYTVEEISAPQGYKLNTSPVKFTITDKNRDIKLTFENTPIQVVVLITKVDEATNLPLAGATLVVKDSTGKEVDRFVTTENAHILTDLPYGTYTVQEVAAPEGYMLSDKIETITIDVNHLSHQVIFKNVKKTPVPDTASTSSIIMLIIGIVTISAAFTLINKNARQ